MSILGFHGFKQFSIVFLLFTVALFTLNIEILSATSVNQQETNDNVQTGGTEVDVTTANKTPDNAQESSGAPEEGGDASELGIFQSCDFDSCNQKNDRDKNKEVIKNPTIKLMLETPPTLELEHDPTLDGHIVDKKANKDSEPASKVEEGVLTSPQQVSTPTEVKQDPTSSLEQNQNQTLMTSHLESSTLENASNLYGAFEDIREKDEDSKLDEGYQRMVPDAVNKKGKKLLRGGAKIRGHYPNILEPGADSSSYNAPMRLSSPITSTTSSSSPEFYLGQDSSADKDSGTDEDSEPNPTSIPSSRPDAEALLSDSGSGSGSGSITNPSSLNSDSNVDLDMESRSETGPGSDADSDSNSDSGSRPVAISRLGSGSSRPAPSGGSSTGQEAAGGAEQLLEPSKDHSALNRQSQSENKSLSAQSPQTSNEVAGSGSSYSPQKVQDADGQSSLEKPSDQRESQQVSGGDESGAKRVDDQETKDPEIFSETGKNIEFPEEENKIAFSSYIDIRTGADSKPSRMSRNAPLEEAEIALENFEMKTSSSPIEALKMEEDAAENSSVPVEAHMATPTRRGGRLNSRRRGGRSRRFMTKRGVSQLLKELNSSKQRRKTFFFRRVLREMSDEDVKLVSTLVEREISNRRNLGVLKRALSSNIPVEPLLGEEWVNREKARNKQ